MLIQSLHCAQLAIAISRILGKSSLSDNATCDFILGPRYHQMSPSTAPMVLQNDSNGVFWPNSNTRPEGSSLTAQSHPPPVFAFPLPWRRLTLLFVDRCKAGGGRAGRRFGKCVEACELGSKDNYGFVRIIRYRIGVSSNTHRMRWLLIFTRNRDPSKWTQWLRGILTNWTQYRKRLGTLRIWMTNWTQHRKRLGTLRILISVQRRLRLWEIVS